MALNIKNAEVESLATEVALLAKETKTEAIRRALEERKARLAVRRPSQSRADQLERFFESEVWLHVPPAQRRKKMTKREREEILGIGQKGYSE